MRVTIEGRVLSVMESWPLQLIVASGGERVAVVLTESTTITRDGKPAKAHDLLPQSTVRVGGVQTARSPRAITADGIELLG